MLMATLSRRSSRAAFARAAASAAAAAMLTPRVPPAFAVEAPLEKTSIAMGLPADSPIFAGFYIAAARMWKQLGLDVQLTSFRGEAEELQALAGGSIDVSVQAIDGIISLVNAGQPVVGFYAGILFAGFWWLAQPTVKTWADLKGGTIAVSAYGALTDQMTRYVLRRHGLEPNRDVQIQAAGGSPGQLAALKSGRATCSILQIPFKWIAEDLGFKVLGTQAQEVASPWPTDVLVAHRDFLDKNPNTVRAFLRGYVAALRLARTNRDLAIDVVNQHVKLDPKYAVRAYDEAMASLDERGIMAPPRSMDVFWKIKMTDGDVKTPWPLGKLMDTRFINTFRQWSTPLTA